jgi:hypothetical protein
MQINIEEIENNNNHYESAVITDVNYNPYALHTDNYVVLNKNEESILEQFSDYKFNYTVKQLLVICDYYGIAKQLKSTKAAKLKCTKANKEEIIEALIAFENDPSNIDIYLQRQNLWYFMNELKKDPFMKKFILF